MHGRSVSQPRTACACSVQPALVHACITSRQPTSWLSDTAWQVQAKLAATEAALRHAQRLLTQAGGQLQARLSLLPSTSQDPAVSNPSQQASAADPSAWYSEGSVQQAQPNGGTVAAGAASRAGLLLQGTELGAEAREMAEPILHELQQQAARLAGDGELLQAHAARLAARLPRLRAAATGMFARQIGRASCRER